MDSKYYQIQNIMNKVNFTANKIKKLFMTDREFSMNKKIEVFNNTLAEIKRGDNRKLKEKFYGGLDEKIIQLLEDTKLNFIIKNDTGNYYYRFIIDSYKTDKELKEFIEVAKKDTNCYRQLSKKYSIKPTEELKGIIELSKLNANQTMAYLYLMQDIEEDKKEAFRELFSIIFYGIENQKTFDKNIVEIETMLENAPLYLFPSSYFP